MMMILVVISDARVTPRKPAPAAARACAATAAASPAGADSSGWLETTAARAAAVDVMPRRASARRSFSSARSVRMRAASSDKCSAAPISAYGRRSRKRNTTASRSGPGNSSIAVSSSGRSRSQSASPAVDAGCSARAAASLTCRRCSEITRLSAALRVAVWSHAASTVWRESFRASRARVVNTCCATSAERCGSPPVRRIAAP